MSVVQRPATPRAIVKHLGSRRL